MNGIELAAHRSGCEVRALGRGPAPIGNVTCGDGWGAARFLVELARPSDDAASVEPEAARLCGETDEESARRVFAFVSSRVRFEKETGEIFRSPRVVLAQGVGDCDCQARLVVALLRACGVPARFAFLGQKGGGPRHVVAQALTSTGWQWLETTVKGARFGENPIAAAVRTKQIRPDVAPGFSEVMTMGGPIGVDGGTVYRMRCASVVESGMMPADPHTVTREALERAGFANVTTYTDAPKSFRVRDLAPGASWTVFAETEYARPECRELESLPAVGGVVVDIVDAWPAVEDLQPTTLAGVDEPKAAAVAPPVVYTKDHTEKFYRDLKQMGADLGIKAEHILAVMQEESGMHASAGYRDGTNFASGLIQIVNLKGVGFSGTHDDFTRLSAEAQLPYVARYYKPWANRGPWTAETLLQLGFVPASIAERGRSQWSVIVAKDGTGYGGQEANFYEVNKGLDADKDGKITVADLKAKIQRAQLAGGARWLEALARLRAAPDPEPAPVLPVVGILLAVGLAILAKS